MRRAESLSEIAEALRSARSIALCGHHNPDGDSIGSVCALTHVLRSMGKEVQPLLSTHEVIPDVYLFLEHADEFLPARDYRGEPDLFLALDVSDRRRIMEAGEVFERARTRVALDHHPDSEEIWDLCYSDPDAAACGVLVWELASSLGFVPDESFASACYVAVMTDTGRFQFQNTDARAFRVAMQCCEAGAAVGAIAEEVYQNRTVASIGLEMLVFERMTLACEGEVVYSWVDDSDLERLGARKQDADNLIDHIRTVKGARVAFFMRASDRDIRGSLRAKDDTDVSAIAAQLSGGGHRAAAGFRFCGTVEDCAQRVVALCQEVLG